MYSNGVQNFYDKLRKRGTFNGISLWVGCPLLLMTFVSIATGGMKYYLGIGLIILMGYCIFIFRRIRLKGQDSWLCVKKLLWVLFILSILSYGVVGTFRRQIESGELEINNISDIPYDFIFHSAVANLASMFWLILIIIYFSRKKIDHLLWKPQPFNSVAQMEFLQLKKNTSSAHNSEEIDFLVWETNKLAICSVMPMAKRFTDFTPIIDSDLVEVWDCLMTVALTGVAANSRNILINAEACHEIIMALNKLWKIGGDLFGDYIDYVTSATEKVGVPFSAASANWVAINLRSHKRANESLKQNADELIFVNRLSSFMNMSFGNSDLCFTTYLKQMFQDVEKEMASAKDTNPIVESDNKVHQIALAIEIYATRMADFIAEAERNP